MTKLLANAALGLLLTVGSTGSLLAQTTNRDGTSGTTTTQTDRDNRGTNWGWLGLVGLIGLAGLVRGNTSTRHRDMGTTGGPVTR